MEASISTGIEAAAALAGRARMAVDSRRMATAAAIVSSAVAAAAPCDGDPSPTGRRHRAMVLACSYSGAAAAGGAMPSSIFELAERMQV